MASYLLPLLPPTFGVIMYSGNLFELQRAERALEVIISDKHREFRTEAPNLDPYLMQYPSGEYILPTLLAHQVTISNQIEKLESK